MKISKIRIENFRSIKLAEFNLEDFNIFVGQNNSGKTNFFEAIEYFYSGITKSSGGIDNLKHKRDSLFNLSVEIEFTGAQDGIAKMVNEKNKTTISKALNGSDVVSFIRTNSDKQRKMFINGIECKPGTGFDAALNDFLPKFEYIHTKQYYDSVAKYATTTPIGKMLSGVLSAILENNPQYISFQTKFNELFGNDESAVKAEFNKMGDKIKIHLAKQFPDTSEVKFEVSIPAFDDLLKNFDTSINDGVETLAEEKGDGMQRALMLAIIQAYADFRKANEDINKSFLFFIDEAELHLHPTAQRNLKNVLYSLSKGMDQVFINTHSSVFVADDFEKQEIFKVEKINGETFIDYIDEKDKQYVVYELLGGCPSDLLLPHNFLIVEGRSEFELMTRVIKRFYPDKPKIQIIQAKGDIDQAEKVVNAIIKTFMPLEKSIFKNKLVLLLDKPSSQTLIKSDQFKSNYKDLNQNSQIFILDKRDIEQCYPNHSCQIYKNWQKTQEEVDGMSSHQKIQLAKHVGNEITKEQFKDSLVTCYKALERTWELAF